MQNHIIFPSLKHSNIFVQCLNVHWVGFRECCVVFLGAKSLNFEDMYFIHLKVLRADTMCETFKWIKLLVVELQKDDLQIPVKMSLGR